MPKNLQVVVYIAEDITDAHIEIHKGAWQQNKFKGQMKTQQQLR